MITVAIDASKAIAGLTELEQSQVPYAMQGTLYDLVGDFQVQEYLHEKDVFEIRQPNWVRLSNKLVHSPTKTELWATIRVQPPGNQDRSDIISKFESDTEKQSRRAGGMVAIPIGARKGKRDIVVPSQRPKAFNFRQVGNRVLGDRGTFIVQSKAHPDLQLILQRNGRGDVQVLYYLMPQVPITPDLEYLETAQWVVANKMQSRFNARWQQALAGAFGGSAGRAAFRDDPLAYLTSRGYSVAEGG